MLVPHGKDPELCRWIIQSFEDKDIYKDNLTVLSWIEECKKILKEDDETTGS
tara:strand:+ start:497 stop:652 length:156 start_codon:yes stop_codon:yes gene_type:complete